jgi:hypothetical protein
MTHLIPGVPEWPETGFRPEKSREQLTVMTPEAHCLVAVSERIHHDFEPA